MILPTPYAIGVEYRSNKVPGCSMFMGRERACGNKIDAIIYSGSRSSREYQAR